MSDLRFDVVEVSDDAAVDAWLRAVSRGFHEGRPSEERLTWLRSSIRDDGQRLVGVHRSAGLGADVPVATFASWLGGLHLGGGRELPLHMITDVTVAPTHRRQGLLRRLMTDDLAHAVASGRPVAALTVSEGGIYGRFGFAPATRLRRVEVDVTPHRFELRQEPDTGGSLVLVEPQEAWPAVRAVLDRVLPQRRGAVVLPSFYEGILTGQRQVDHDGPDGRLHAVLHLSESGDADGFALFRHAGEDTDPPTLDVADLAAASPAVELRLWRFLADVDLVERVRWRRAALDFVLPHALRDPRAVRTTEVRDQLWVRVLDVVAALEARPWGADGRVVLEVDDPLGHAAGRWAVEVSGGAASVARVEADADLRLDVETLGALYLGDVATSTLVDAGRLTGSPGALATWAALADVGSPPYCTTGF